MHSPLVCPMCGRAGQQSGEWVRPNVAAGELLAGLDPQSCPGCWDTMTQNGIAPGTFTTDARGGHSFASLPRPAQPRPRDLTHRGADLVHAPTGDYTSPPPNGFPRHR